MSCEIEHVRISRRRMLALLASTAATGFIAGACSPAQPASQGGSSSPTQASGGGGATSTQASAATPAPKQQVQVIVWGANTTAPGGDKTMIDTFNSTHDDMQIKAESVPQVAGQSPDQMQKILTAIAAGTVPDFFYLDRFLCVDFASKKAILPQDEYISASTLKREDFVGACWDEASWQGKQYAIPASEGNIGYWSLAYNRQLMEDAKLDPDSPPKTWEETKDYAIKMTEQSGQGYKQIGMVPLWGASFLYQWAWSNGGFLASDDGKKITMTDPKVVEALEFLVGFYDALGGYEKINAFSQGFQTAANDPFLTGLIGEVVFGEYQLPALAQYKPDLKLGVSFFPVPKEGDPKVSWVGGWSWALPKGSKQPEPAFKAIEWLATEPGLMAWQEGAAAVAAQSGGVWIPLICAYLKANDLGRQKYLPALKEKAPDIAAGYEFYYNAPQAYDKLYFRPKVLIASQLWDAQLKAAQEACYKQKTAQQALSDWQATCQAALDEAWSKLE